jgi:hypothetical protein
VLGLPTDGGQLHPQSKFSSIAEYPAAKVVGFRVQGLGLTRFKVLRCSVQRVGIRLSCFSRSTGHAEDTLAKENDLCLEVSQSMSPPFD